MINTIRGSGIVSFRGQNGDSESYFSHDPLTLDAVLVSFEELKGIVPCLRVTISDEGLEKRMYLMPSNGTLPELKGFLSANIGCKVS